MTNKEEFTKRKLVAQQIKKLIYLKAEVQGRDALSVAEEMLEESKKRRNLNNQNKITDTPTTEED